MNHRNDNRRWRPRIRLWHLFALVALAAVMIWLWPQFGLRVDHQPGVGSRAVMIWGGHPIAQSVTGTRETVAEFGRNDVQSHYAAHYRPANAVLSMAGRLEAGAVQDLVSRTFGGWGESDRGKVAAPGLDGQGAPARCGDRSCGRCPIRTTSCTSS